MKTKHTRGNWQAQAPNPNADESAGERRTYHWAVRTFYEPAAGNGRCGHQVCEISSMNTGTEEADARLIAAAPELLEATQAFDKLATQRELELGSLSPEMEAVVRQVRAAIGKATQ